MVDLPATMPNGGIIINRAYARSVLPAWTMAYEGETPEGVVHFLSPEDVFVSACGRDSTWVIPFALAPEVALCDDCRLVVREKAGVVLHSVPSEGDATPHEDAQ